MKVKTLLKILAKQDPKAEVVIRNYEGDGFGGYPIYHSEPITSWDVINRKDDDGLVNEFCLYFLEEDIS